MLVSVGVGHDLINPQPVQSYPELKKSVLDNIGLSKLIVGDVLITE